MARERGEFYDKIYDMASQGFRINEMSTVLGNAISKQRISQLREEIFTAYPHLRNIFEKRQQAIYDRQVQSIKEFINDCNVEQIAIMLEISKSSVYKIIKDENIKKTRKPKPPIIEKGSMYGWWEVGDMIEERNPSTNDLIRYYSCKCTGCGIEGFKVRQSNLLAGLSESCKACGYKRRSVPSL